MPITITWIVPRRVLLTTLTGDIEQQDILELTENIRARIAEGEKPVYHISDSRQLGKVAVSLAGFQKMLKSVSMFSELAWTIDINTHALNKMLAAIASQFVGVRGRTVASLDDAIAFIKFIDPALQTAEWTIPAPAQQSSIQADEHE
jgi:hypothetical protein